MPRKVELDDGDCLARVANQSGFYDPDRIRQCSANQSLFDERPNPQCLNPGDVITVPDPELVTHQGQCEDTVNLAVKRIKAQLEIQILDTDGMPVADGGRFTLTTHPSGIEIGGGLSHGLVRATVPIEEHTATLTLEYKPRTIADENRSVSWVLRMGSPQELGTDETDVNLAAVQMRLKNLGFYFGRPRPTPPPKTVGEDPGFDFAVRLFQMGYGLKVSGQIDGPTLAKLRAVSDGDSAGPA